MLSPLFTKLTLIFLWTMIPLSFLFQFSLSQLEEAIRANEQRPVFCGGGIATYTKVVAPLVSPEAQAGEALFKQNCTSCHNMNRVLVGPPLEGVTERVTLDWMKGFVRDPQGYVQHDDYAKAIWEENNKMAMTAFPFLSDAKLEALWQYFEEYETLPERSIVIACP
ncbi:MAG: cytochrome c [Bacteroidota bacterium]